MLEGVLKEQVHMCFATDPFSFNPWYVGGGVKSVVWMCRIVLNGSFNPWYVGGGVKRRCLPNKLDISLVVSILGMLEGVLKVTASGP